MSSLRKTLVGAAMAAGKPLVLDADALNLLALSPGALAQLGLLGLDSHYRHPLLRRPTA